MDARGGGVGGRSSGAGKAEALLGGADVGDLDRHTVEDAGTAAAEDAAPVDDANGSAEYKAQLVSVLLKRTLAEAAAEPSR